jgi:hypothetical protein
MRRPRCWRASPGPATSAPTSPGSTAPCATRSTRRHAGSAHAGIRLLPDDAGRRRRPRDPRARRVGDPAAGAHGRRARARGVPRSKAEACRRGRSGCAQGHRVGRGARVRRRAGRARDDARGNQGGRRVAHAAGKIKVAAHAHGARSIKDAILAGADTIEHASLIDDEAIALAREHGVALSMDVYNGDYIDTEGASRAGRRSSCARTSRPPRRSARASRGASRRRRHRLRHRRCRVSARPQCAAVPDHGPARHDADAGDPGCDLGRGEAHGLDDRIGSLQPGRFRRPHRGARRSARRTSRGCRTSPSSSRAASCPSSCRRSSAMQTRADGQDRTCMRPPSRAAPHAWRRNAAHRRARTRAR